MIRRPPRSTPLYSSAASDVYKRQVVQPCLSGGLWDAGANITVGGKHIANWLIGQVRNEEIDEELLLKYADEIGADREAFKEALSEVPIMSTSLFKKTSEML